MARLTTFAPLQKLGVAPAQPPLTDEQIEAARKVWQERDKLSWRLRLTPSLARWIWGRPEALREIAQRVVARLTEEQREKNDSGKEIRPLASEKGTSGSRPAPDKNKSRCSDDPLRITLENLKKSGTPEDVRDFLDQLKLYRQLFSEEAERLGLRWLGPLKDNTNGKLVGE